MGRISGRKRKRTATIPVQSILSRQNSARDRKKTGNYVLEYKHTSEKKTRQRQRYSLTGDGRRNASTGHQRQGGPELRPMLIFNLRFYKVFDFRFSQVVGASILSFTKSCPI